MSRENLRAKYGPWAVVTGASDGIGRAIALELAASGIHLVLVARRDAELQLLAQKLMTDHQIEARVMAADLASPAAIERVVRGTADISVGLFVAAAGFGTSGMFVEGDVDEELALVDVNCRAVLAMCHPFAKRFVAQRRGGIVLFSSLLGFQGVPRAATYAASKAFIQSFAEALRLELQPHHVDVLSCAPGPTHSGFAKRARMKMGLAATPQIVARASLRAIGRSGLVRPGWLSKFLELSLKLLPRWGRVRVLGLVMKGMASSAS